MERKHDHGAEAMVLIDSTIESADIVLSALRAQLKEQVIDFDTYNDRRSAYLQTRQGTPGDEAA